MVLGRVPTEKNHSIIPLPPVRHNETETTRVELFDRFYIAYVQLEMV